MHKRGGFMTGQEITERAHRAAENVWFSLLGRAAMIAVSLMLVPTVYGLITWLNNIEKRQNDHGERMAIIESEVKEDHGTLIKSTEDRLTFQADIARRVATAEQQIDGIEKGLKRIEDKLDRLIEIDRRAP